MRLKQVYLEEQQIKLLRHLSETTGIPESALIRRAIDLFIRTAWTWEVLPGCYRERAWEEEQAALDAWWAEAGGEAAAQAGGGRSWRREDLYERSGPG